MTLRRRIRMAVNIAVNVWRGVAGSGRREIANRHTGMVTAIRTGRHDHAAGHATSWRHRSWERLQGQLLTLLLTKRSGRVAYFDIVLAETDADSCLGIAHRLTSRDNDLTHAVNRQA